MLAGNVIDAARDRHAAFSPQRHPNKGALRFLSQYVKRLHGKVLGIDPDALRIEVVTTLPLADFEAGIALPANTQYIAEVAGRYPASIDRPPYPITLIDSAARNALNAPRGAAWQVGSTLYLRSPSTLWRDFNGIAVSVVTLPTELAALEDDLALPDAAELACTEAVAFFLAKREAQEDSTEEGEKSAINLQSFAAAAAEAEEDYLTTLRTALSGKVFFTQDVWRP